MCLRKNDQKPRVFAIGLTPITCDVSFRNILIQIVEKKISHKNPPEQIVSTKFCKNKIKVFFIFYKKTSSKDAGYKRRTKVPNSYPNVFV